jgi:hypothetical protein
VKWRNLVARSRAIFVEAVFSGASKRHSIPRRSACYYEERSFCSAYGRFPHDSPLKPCWTAPRSFDSVLLFADGELEDEPFFFASKVVGTKGQKEVRVVLPMCNKRV